MTRKVRVRFAPSPTGALHIGGVRTALYNYLFAKKHGGDFILRIEDTDSAREMRGSIDYIIKSLEWCGITPNEGYGFGDGDCAPYIQSHRNSHGIYKVYVDSLLKNGNAYYAFDTKESLDEIRASKKSFAYNIFTRESLVNSLTLSAEEVKRRIDAGDPYVIRMKVPKDVEIKFKDLVKGLVTVKSNTIDDKVLFKSDGMPTYHLANVVDDHMMDISHVIRGEEWLPSAPLHIMLYKMFGWEDSMPEFAHLPLILGPNGKLSKRDGDSYGFPVYPLVWTDPNTGEKSSGYRESGYLPDAFINMLAFLGWNPGDTVELMSMDEMINKFSLERVGKAGAKFDLKKTDWFNHQYLIKSDNDTLAALWGKDLIKNLLEDKETSDKNLPGIIDEKVRGFGGKDSYVSKVCGLLKQKVSNINMFWERGRYFFIPPKPSLSSENSAFIAEVIAGLSGIDDFTHDNIRIAFDEAVKSSGEDPRNAGKLLRIAVTGMEIGPPLFDVIELLGKNESLNRLAANVVINHE
jgi:glutamyl-tRNA synthetase